MRPNPLIPTLIIFYPHLSKISLTWALQVITTDENLKNPAG
jgi:hypothetical protein